MFRPITVAIAGAMMAFAISDVLATETMVGGISVRAGVGEHYQRIELAWESPSLWRHQFSGGYGRLDLIAEVGAAYWKAKGSRSPSDSWQFSAIPILRWTLNERYYIEAGVGPTAFTRTRFADKVISTAFQFGDHIGVGAYLSNTSRLGLRFSHFSNASIEKSNPGLNIVQLTYTYRY
ncbi:acyloxyacyl hydrolase [Candidimonas sp. SYP-B2681]|nr:acyloxyacyl hydrolase [Candidimonas sp. SYP-B2681]